MEKLFILAIVEDIPEVYENIKIIMDKLQLYTEKLKFCMASDLKLINTIGKFKPLNISVFSVKVLFKNQFFFLSLNYSL